MRSNREVDQIERRWVMAAEYAKAHSLAVQTLANWRHEDNKAKRRGPRPGFPAYRKFGNAVRYWLPADEEPQAAA